MSFRKRITRTATDLHLAAQWALFGARVIGDQVASELASFRAELERVRAHCGL